MADSKRYRRTVRQQGALSAAPRLPAAVCGQLVRLRPIARIDHLILFTWRNDDRWPSPFFRKSDRFSSAFSPLDRVLSFDEWGRAELQYLLEAEASLMIETVDGGVPIGIIFMNNVSNEHRWAHYTEFFPDQTRPTWHAAEATFFAQQPDLESSVLDLYSSRHKAGAEELARKLVTKYTNACMDAISEGYWGLADYLLFRYYFGGTAQSLPDIDCPPVPTNPGRWQEWLDREWGSHNDRECHLFGGMMIGKKHYDD